MRSNQCKVKICGTTSVLDGEMVIGAGADYVGVVVEAHFSERAVTIADAAAIARQMTIPIVMLVFDRTRDWIQCAVETIRPFAIQLLGHETPTEVECLKKKLPCEVWKSLFLPAGQTEVPDPGRLFTEMKAYTDAGTNAFLFDSLILNEGKVRFGGTGRTIDWNLASTLVAASKVPAFLSGGIQASNVRQAIDIVGPYGIDLCSGVEATKGIRDAQKLELLMDQVRETS